MSTETVMLLRQLDETTPIVVIHAVQIDSTCISIEPVLPSLISSQYSVGIGVGRLANALVLLKAKPHVVRYHTVVPFIPDRTSGSTSSHDTSIYPENA